MTIPTQNIAFINGQFLNNGRHIYDVIASLRRGFEMGDHLLIKGMTPLKVLI